MHAHRQDNHGANGDPARTARHSGTRAARIALALALAGGVGCRTQPEPVLEPLPAPAVSAHVLHFAGSPLSGPTDNRVEVSGPRDALQVMVTFVALEDLPDDLLQPMGPNAQLIAATRGGLPILPSARLTRGARAGDLQDTHAFLADLTSGLHGRSAPLARLRGALPLSVTAAFRIMDAKPHLDPSLGAPIQETVEVRVHRTPDAALRVIIVVEDLVPAAVQKEPIPAPEHGEEGPTLTRPAPPPALAREVVALDPHPGPDLQFAVLLPSPFHRSPAAAIAALIQVTAPPAPNDPASDPHAQAVARCIADLARTGAEARDRAQATPASRVFGPGFETALSAMQTPARQRGALVFLASTTDASLAEAVALGSDDAVVAAVATGVSTAAKEAPLDDKAALAWLLDRETIIVAAGLLAESQGSPALNGILVRHLGELARQAPLLGELAAAATSGDDFRLRVIAENRLALEDSSPAVRVRAFDWLAARGVAPAGYDPLAPVKERRQALARAAATPADKSAEGETP